MAQGDRPPTKFEEMSYQPEPNAWVTYDKTNAPRRLRAESLGEKHLQWWMREMYEWGLRVREDILDLESVLTPEQTYRIHRRKLERGREADPGDPPPPPPTND